ncbi:Fic family protein [Pedobacter sp. UYP24]
MDKSIPLHLQDVIFSSSDPVISRTISKLEKLGQLKKIAPRVYTPAVNETAEVIVKRNLFKIIGHLFPGIMLSHRTALEFKPTSTGDMFFTFSFERKVRLPGITLNIMKGVAPLEGDTMNTHLRASQIERAMLENLQESRKPGPRSRTLTLPEVEERLESIVRVRGEKGLNEFRESAKSISLQVGMEKEFEKLNKLISAMLATKPSNILNSPLAIARALGHPYNPSRIQLFEKLFVELKQREFADIPDKNSTQHGFRNFAFIESYFSNFIEGTKFTIEEALQIIETGKPLVARDEDSHDVLGTYQLVSNRKEMSVIANTPDKLLEILQYRHAILLAARPYKNPGLLKSQNNQAGSSYFVDHKLVNGTLTQGFEFYLALKDPFARAAYMMFMISEVHPFDDGNGRIARIMMNAELVASGQTKIIIPSVFREDYLGGLRLLTRKQEPDTYIRMLQRAQLFSATIHGKDMDQILDLLKASNAFEEGEDSILIF